MPIQIRIVWTDLYLFILVKAERYSQAVRSMEFDRFLGPYNLSQYGEWKRLSDYITKDTIERLGMYFHKSLSLFLLAKYLGR